MNISIKIEISLHDLSLNYFSYGYSFIKIPDIP